ncbi:DUF7848 domain-containing protein [Streptomyces syringium]|uniref:DUF7848 domain-containing protein n=1 Tax=Streptomyces syringium TaxID=76729 RepID=UPI003F53EE7B
MRGRAALSSDAQNGWWALEWDMSGSGPVYEVECTTCGGSSESSEGSAGPDAWALQHADQTGHTGYRNILTRASRASRSAGSP